MMKLRDQTETRVAFRYITTLKKLPNIYNNVKLQH